MRGCRSVFGGHGNVVVSAIDGCGVEFARGVCDRRLPGYGEDGHMGYWLEWNDSAVGGCWEALGASVCSGRGWAGFPRGGCDGCRCGLRDVERGGGEVANLQDGRCGEDVGDAVHGPEEGIFSGWAGVRRRSP